MDPLFNYRDSLYTEAVQLELFFRPQPANLTAESALVAGSRSVRLWFVRHPRARRYILRLQRDGTARVTIPRGGTLGEAQRFAEQHASWLEQRLLKEATRPVQPSKWQIGTQILFRGEWVGVESNANGEAGIVHFRGHRVRVPDPNADLRPAIERYLVSLAAAELPARTLELAALHGLKVRRITVRNQKSRWGSCSPRGTVSLNWRLVQTPEFVRDYIVVHELAHLKQMNHSRRFWEEVARLCPAYGEAEHWLKQHSKLLL